MSKSINAVTLMGNLTRDPELRQAGESSVAGFSIALNRSYKVNDEWQEQTDYIDISAWGNLAEQVMEYLKQGSKVLVQGRLTSRTWEKDGEKRSKVEVNATDVTFLDPKAQSDDRG